MTNLFIITASNPAAQQHIRDTIEQSIPTEKVEKHFSGFELEQIKLIGLEHGYHAWGATPGEKNIPTWERMQIGDLMLVYQHKTYTYYAKVLFKARNRDFALENWGQDEEGNTWEYMYLLERPIKFESPINAKDLADYLPASYRGFMQITGDRAAKIIADHGSIEMYLSKVIPDFKTFLAAGLNYSNLVLGVGWLRSHFRHYYPLQPS
jgi:hypothetical protein